MNAIMHSESVAGKYLTFALGKETYGLDILNIQGIIGMQEVTKTPKTPSFVRGAINLHGEVISVVDLRLKLGFESREDTERTCIIVAQVERESGQEPMGLVVDEVCEVLDIAAGQIEDTPDFGATVDARFIIGMGKVRDELIMLLDADRVLSGSDPAATNEVLVPGRDTEPEGL